MELHVMALGEGQAKSWRGEPEKIKPLTTQKKTKKKHTYKIGAVCASLAPGFGAHLHNCTPHTLNTETRKKRKPGTDKHIPESRWTETTEFSVA